MLAVSPVKVRVTLRSSPDSTWPATSSWPLLSYSMSCSFVSVLMACPTCIVYWHQYVSR